MAKAHAVVLISDMHVGRNAEGMDEDSLHRRIHKFVSRSLEFLGKFNGGLEKITVALLGDIVDGEEIYRNHGYELMYNINDQLDIAYSLLEKLYTHYSLRSDTEFYCAPGNHGRANWRGKGNWDEALCQMMEKTMPVYLSTDDDLPMIDTPGGGFLFMHGHNIRMYMNVPWYGIDRLVTRLGYTLDFRWAGMGHFHTFGMMRVADKDVFLNGTMLYDDPWAMKRFGLKPDTRWWVIYITEEGAIHTGIDTR